MSIPNISQAQTITVINNYLKWHNLPVHWNNTGVCNGLATIHAHYVLQDKEDVFLQMLHKISAMTQGDFSQSTVSDSPEEDLDHFISQVILAYNPSIFAQNLSQRDSHKAFKINGAPLRSDFVLPLVTSDKNWTKILKDIDLQPGEMFKVLSNNHAISLYRSNGQYVVFDPNYPEGIKKFSDEKDLVKELRSNVFQFIGSDMALNLTQISSAGFKKDSSRTRAKPAKYIKEYFDIDAMAFYPPQESVTNDVYIAAMAGDKETMQAYFDMNHDKEWTPSELKDLAIKAILYNNRDSLDVILNTLYACPMQTEAEKKDKEDVLNVIILLALRDGRNELVQKIIADDYGKKIFKSLDDSTLLNMAARGGNPELLNNILKRIQNNSVKTELWGDTDEVEDNQASEDLDDLGSVIQMNLSDLLGDDLFDEEKMPQSKKTEMTMMLFKLDSRGDNAITCAIKSNSPECLEILLKQLTKEGYVPTVKEYQSFLSVAINKNDIRMVDKLINHIDPDKRFSVVSDMTLNSEQMKKTNLHILKTLEKNGLSFEEQGQAIVAEKEAQKPGIIEIIGVKLVKFIDYMQAALGLKSASQMEANPFVEAQASSSPHAEQINSLNASPKEKMKAIFNDFKQKHQALKPLDNNDELVPEGPRPGK